MGKLVKDVGTLLFLQLLPSLKFSLNKKALKENKTCALCKAEREGGRIRNPSDFFYHGVIVDRGQYIFLFLIIFKKKTDFKASTNSSCQWKKVGVNGFFCIVLLRKAFQIIFLMVQKWHKISSPYTRFHCGSTSSCQSEGTLVVNSLNAYCASSIYYFCL